MVAKSQKKAQKPQKWPKKGPGTPLRGALSKWLIGRENAIFPVQAAPKGPQTGASHRLSGLQTPPKWPKMAKIGTFSDFLVTFVDI